MKCIPPDRWRAILLVYVIGGLGLGLCNRPLNLLAQGLGVRPGLGTALNVNVLMPLLAIAMAFCYPRLRTIWPGAVGATAAFYLGMRLVQQPDVRTWTAHATMVGIHPILVVACVGYGALGSLVALAVRPWRIVSLPDAHLRCTSCDYLLVGLTEPKCPECGAEFDPAKVTETKSPGRV